MTHTPEERRHARQHAACRDQRHEPDFAKAWELEQPWLNGDRDDDLTPEDWAFGRRVAGRRDEYNTHGGWWGQINAEVQAITMGNG